MGAPRQGRAGATFAAGLGVGAGDRITLNGRPFTVTGIAVTAASAPYPDLCYYSVGGCRAGCPITDRSVTGLLWLTKPDFSLAAVRPVITYVVDLKLKNPATAVDAFALPYDRAWAAGDELVDGHRRRRPSWSGTSSGC